MSQGNAKGGNITNINATSINGVAVTGTPSTGQVLTATSTTAANWQTSPGSDAVIFEATLASSPENITSNRSIHQSPTTTPSSYAGVINFGSDTSGSTTGVSASYATISGGDQNIVSGDHGSVIGGLGNQVSNSFGVAGGQQNIASGYGAIALGVQTTASGGFSFTANANTIASGAGSVALGYWSASPRYAQFSFSSAGDVASPGIGGSSQYGHLVYAVQQTTPGTSFVITDAGSSEMSLASMYSSGNQYYAITIKIVLASNNTTSGPAYWKYEVLAHVAGGHAIIDNQQQNITTPDPNLTGWLTSITVDGTNALLHINVNPNGDSANTINATADIQWAEIIGFTQ